MNESECRAPSFNLVDEPWIRVRDETGEVRELSLLELFSQASHLKCLSNDLPTQDFAILRVLLAILQRAISPGLYEEDAPAEVWGKLWNASELPMDEISAYLEKWHSRFDLFDEERPFIQVAELKRSKELDGESPLGRLIADVPSRKARRFFSMRNGAGIDCLTFGESARWLIHAQAFDTGGAKSAAEGDKTAKRGKAYPDGPGWDGRIGGIFLEGSTLRETLLLNFVLARTNEYDRLFDDDDLPTWEKESCTVEEGHEARLSPIGRADLFTWQSRWVKLVFSEQDVVDAVLTAGDKFSNIDALQPIETMTAWRLDKKTNGIRCRAHVHDYKKALWRGLDSILAKSIDSPSGGTSDNIAPGIIDWTRYLSEHNGGTIFADGYRIAVHAVGFKYSDDSYKSSYLELIDDRLDLNAFLLSRAGQSLDNLACECVDATEEAVTALGKLSANLHLASGGDKEQMAGPRDAIKARAYFEIDQAFRTWLAELDMHTNAPDARTAWYRKARGIVLAIGEETANRASPVAVVGSAVKYEKKKDIVWMTAAKAWSWFQRDLKRALPTENDPSDTKEG